MYKGRIVASLVLFKEITGTADVLYKIRDKLKVISLLYSVLLFIIYYSFIYILSPLLMVYTDEFYSDQWRFNSGLQFPPSRY